MVILITLVILYEPLTVIGYAKYALTLEIGVIGIKNIVSVMHTKSAMVKAILGG